MVNIQQQLIDESVIHVQIYICNGLFAVSSIRERCSDGNRRQRQGFDEIPLESSLLASIQCEDKIQTFS